VQLFPTRPTVHVALAALGTVTLGMVLRQPAVLAWGGAMIAGLAVVRATNKLAVLRLRAAGLEMIWREPRKVRRVVRTAESDIEVELCNRDVRPTHFCSLRAVASRELTIEVEPREAAIAPGASLTVHLRIRAPRVGRYCVHGLALEVKGPPGLFEVPLAFASPIGFEVVPRSTGAFVSSARGGRSRRAAEAGAAERRPGAGTELYQLREHVSGDPFKRIAWKASARRGALMVREFEREDRDVVWLVLDAAVEQWAGAPGTAPLDRSVDEVAAVAERHLARGDSVGLAIAGASPRTWLSPDRGARHGMELVKRLIDCASLLDADRSDYDESDIARRVLDHLRFLDTASVAALRADQLESLQSYAEMQRARAPFDLPLPWAASPREQSLRRYLACFGISSPPRLEQDRTRATGPLVQALERAAGEKPRPSLVYVWSTPPEEPSPALAKTAKKLFRRGIAVRWISTVREDAAAFGIGAGDDEASRAVADAVVLRTRLARERGERQLAAMGIRVARPGTLAHGLRGLGGTGA
jgi:uncharacterized protein (DUF58 family)